jgi:phosphotriesterase-related protein
MPSVETVGGPVDLDDLGTTLVHEHLRMRSSPVDVEFPHLYDEDDTFRRATAVATGLLDQGVKTICDPSCMYHGRDVRFQRRVVEETGLQVVPCTGIYTYDQLPQYFRNRDADQMAEVFVHDIEVGIQSTEVKAAFLKCAVDEPGLTEDVEKVLRACARASTRTGRPLMVHSHPKTRRGLEIMDVLDEEGVDPATVQIAHTGDTDDLDYIDELLARGPFIGMDRYGTEIFLPDDRRDATILALLERGHADRMFLSADACAEFDWFPPELVAQMAPNWKSTYVFDGVVPRLREAGMTDEQLEQMTVANVKAWLGSQ